MICSKCGKELFPGDDFCPNCGTKVEITKGKKSGVLRGILLFFVGLILGGSIVATLMLTDIISIRDTKVDTKSESKAKKSKYEGSGFETKEDAMKAYLKAFEKGDIEEIYKCYAIETLVENYQMKQQCKRFGGYTAYSSISFPLYGELSRSILTTARLNDVNKVIYYRYGMLSGWDLDEIYSSAGRSFDSENEIDEFIDEYFPNKEKEICSKCEIVSFYEPEEILGKQWTNTEKMNQNIIDVYGCEDYDSIGVVFKNNGKYYFIAQDLIKYNGRWFLLISESKFSAILQISITDGQMWPLGENFDEDDYRYLYED